MAKSAMSFAKGMGAGIAAGVVVTAVGKAVMDNRKSFVKKTGKAMKAVGAMVDNISGILK